MPTPGNHHAKQTVRTVKNRPYPHKKPPKRLEGFGTIQELAKLTGVSVRTLYRLRIEGKLRSWEELNPRVVVYHLEKCAQEVAGCYE